MKATIALFCFTAAVAYAVAAVPPKSPIIDNGPLDPRCVKPYDCHGDGTWVFYYNTTKGCLKWRLGRDCVGNGNYETLQECLENCAGAPGKQVKSG
uniref:Putative tick kunitz 70 n=1 Tax=Ixodes ricinus TaxID=34613 RepID=V5IDB9_IXORI